MTTNQHYDHHGYRDGDCVPAVEAERMERTLSLIREWAESDPNGDVRSSTILRILDSMNCPYDCGHRVCPIPEEDR